MKLVALRSVLPDKLDVSDYLRPWKLASLSVGIALLIAGSFYERAPDWDVSISFIMAFFAYVFAPWSMRVILERRWRMWPAMLLATWFTVDGCYAIYWHFVNPVALDLMREANFPASLSLYGMCGIIWLYRGSLSQLASEARALVLPQSGRATPPAAQCRCVPVNSDVKCTKEIER